MSPSSLISRQLRALYTGALVSCVLCACATEVPTFYDYGSARQIDLETSLSHIESPWLWVVVVDDTPTPDGLDLRSQVAEQLIGWADAYHSWDPGVYTPQHIEVLIIGASDPLSARHPGNHSALRLVSKNATSANSASWENAIADGIRSVVTSEQRPATLLSSLEYWVNVLDGSTSPPDEAAATFVSELPERMWVNVFILSTRDDESPNASVSRFYLRDARVPITTCTNEYSKIYHASDSRLSEVSANLISACQPWFFRRGGVADGGYSCEEGTLARRENGQVACRVHAFIDIEQECPAEFGFVDPVNADGSRVPEIVELIDRGPTLTRRKCEVLQLEGAALSSCQSELACSDCLPGWCFREPFERDPVNHLVSTCAAQPGFSLEQFRFVNGTDTAARGDLRIRCAKELGPEL